MTENNLTPEERYTIYTKYVTWAQDQDFAVGPYSMLLFLQTNNMLKVNMCKKFLEKFQK